MKARFPMCNMSIKARLVVIGLVTAAGLSVMVGLGWIKGSEMVDAVTDAESLRLDITEITAMKLANVELVLAAMDSIVDRSEGQIQPERFATMNEAIALIRDGAPVAYRVAGALDRTEVMTSFDKDVDEVAEAVTVQLKRLIESGAAESEYSSLDEVIDGGGERINIALTTLADLGGTAVHDGLESAKATAEGSRISQTAIAATFLALIGIMTFLIGRSIIDALSRFGNDMTAIAGGELSRTITAEGRNDEMGRMARTLAAFREAAKGKMQAEEEARTARELSADEARMRSQERARTADAQKAALDVLSSALGKLAGGDLEYRIKAGLPQEFAAMADNYNEAVEALRATLAEVGLTTVEIDSATLTLSSSADDLSIRTEQQAAGVEQSSAALHQLTENVRSTAEIAGKAVVRINETGAEARNSGVVVEKAVAAMGEIEESSSRISNIISVIDEIAFQTNLLALNAGVEAARAGEAGKGFAVVAQEVRELAQRCANAANEIKGLITISHGQVKSGVGLVEETGKALAGIIDSVGEVQAMMSRISEANQHQSSGLSEVSRTVDSMEKITQSNAAMAQGNRGEIHKLRRDVDILAAKISNFKTGGANVPAAMARGGGQRHEGDAQRRYAAAS